MPQNDIRKSLRYYIIRPLIIGGLLVIITNGIYMLTIWLIGKTSLEQNRYFTSELAYLITCILCLAILSVLLLINYRRRKRELTTLSESIEKVARGDFSSRITYSNHDTMAHVYKSFNKMSAELSSVQFLKKDFINNFSHEFKTPIASIHGFASLMLEKDLPKEEQIEYLTIIKEESDRLSRLTSNTILLSKLSSQEFISKTELFNLGEQLRQCSIILSHQWLDKKLNFTGDFPDLEFCGNRELLQHLWLNLIGNAINHTPTGGDVTVTLSKEKDKIIVRISDTGEGMSEYTMQHIFIPYYQGNSSNSKEGLGLGLAISKQIVSLCEGDIYVESTLNEGSTFTVEFTDTCPDESLVLE